MDNFLLVVSLLAIPLSIWFAIAIVRAHIRLMKLFDEKEKRKAGLR